MVLSFRIVSRIANDNSGTLLGAGLVGEWERHEDDAPKAVGRHCYPDYSRS